MNNDLYSVGPFNRVVFAYSRGEGFQTYRYRQHNLERTGTRIDTLPPVLHTSNPGWYPVFERMSWND